MRMLVMLTCVMLSSSAFANCTTNARGVTTCNNGQTAGGYNPNTGNAVKAQTNQAGVTTTQTSKGGEAKTVNGKGVYKAPNGTICYKGVKNQGCR
ncbi:hypothetical protein R75461_08471 [Paraburkholderia nemoris]|uniref:hypothetical protein n=1 Tax=Paraburkholderia nemoris TaxID=2793076 RepID=UPI00190CCAE7|nr:MULTISPECIES: hypothetical protein [Paraburkholderia]MBK3787240.1 hypothetical protein [Paraburkholderia aspalathi]CAE6869131.1 hypothetical protein R75461_08471 [Paraburkholderia nemoris]